jgi:hypothetical protein
MIWFGDPALGLLFGVAMVLTLIAATLAGVAIPLIMERLGVDPALASGVCLTTATDVVGLLTSSASPPKCLLQTGSRFEPRKGRNLTPALGLVSWEMPLAYSCAGLRSSRGAALYGRRGARPGGGVCCSQTLTSGHSFFLYLAQECGPGKTSPEDGEEGKRERPTTPPRRS